MPHRAVSGASPDLFACALRRLWPEGDRNIRGLLQGMVDSADDAFKRYQISSDRLVAHVMAQISHECGAGREAVENLNYTAARIIQVWPKRFPTLASAEPYAHAPRALANQVYNGRMGNRVGSDDGWFYRGRGAAQTTGRDGYARLAGTTGLDLVSTPDLVLDPRYFLLCGVADFVACGCLPFARADDLVGVTRRLNGGLIGLDQRRAWLARWKAALGEAAVVTASPPLAPSLPKPAPPAAVPAPQPSPWRQLIAALAAALRRT